MGPDESRHKVESSGKTLNLCGKGVDKLDSDIDLEQIVALQLSKNNISELPPDLLKLNTLVLAYNKMVNLNTNLMSTLKSYINLEVLDLSHNEISYIPDIFSELISLKKLNLFGNKISELDLEDTQLISIDIGQNRFSELPKLPSTLVSLNADHNFITSIDVGFNYLSKLCLSHNKITSISPLNGFPSLFVLDIAHNKLKKIAKLHEMCPRLKQFDGSNNSFTKFPSFPRTINEIHIQKNMISQINSSLVALKVLVYLDISRNKISNIPSLPPLIQTLILYGNEIKTITNSLTPELLRVFAMNNEMEEIPMLSGNSVSEYYFASNRISAVDMKWFCKAVTRIDLSRNSLKSIPDDLFQLPSLHFLFIQHNEIQLIPPTISESSLILLNISFNPISSIEITLPASLEQFFMAGCSASKVPQSLQSIEELLEVDMSNNELTFFPLINSVRILNLSSNKLRQFPEISLSIESLDLSHNLIEEIPQNFDYLYLIDLDLSYNCIKQLPKPFMIDNFRSLKLQNNPMRGWIYPEECKNMGLLDISGTRIGLAETPTAIGQVFTSNDAMFVSHRISIMKHISWGSYSSRRGDRESKEDSIVFRPEINPNTHLFALIDGRGRSKAASHSSFRLVKAFQKHKDSLDNNSILKLIEKVETKMFSKKNSEIPPLGALVLYMNHAFLISSGEMKLMVINKDGSIDGEDIKMVQQDQVSLNRIHGPLSISNSFGSFLVFRKSLNKKLHEIQINSNHKWIIIMNVGIFEILPSSDIQQSSLTSKDSQELAYKLRNKAFSGMGMDNLSIIVIDVDEYLKKYYSYLSLMLS